jgi:predicted RNA binding protein YcfA (HicA-like mRNA interferase family)
MRHTRGVALFSIMRINLSAAMPAPETNTRKIISRLEREGWVNIGSGTHDKFKYDARPGVVIVAPRNRTLSADVARSIAKLASWN